MGSRLKFDDSFLTKSQADNFYHNENENLNLHNHRITNLKDAECNTDAISGCQLNS